MDTPEHAPIPELNTGKDRKKYPYKNAYLNGCVYVYFRRSDFQPVSKPPFAQTADVGFRRIAWLVKRLTNEGAKKSQIRKVVEADYRAFRDRHLVKTVLLYRLKNVMNASIKYEEEGRNTWPYEGWDVPEHPELVAYRFNQKPKA